MKATELFVYHDKGLWRNSLFIHIVMWLLLWLPVSGLLFYLAVELGLLSMYLLSASLSLFFGLALFNRAQSNLCFPTLELCEHHLIINTTLNRRRVYNLDYIQGARFVWHVLYFRHKGWPILVPLPVMPKNQRRQMLVMLGHD